MNQDFTIENGQCVRTFEATPSANERRSKTMKGNTNSQKHGLYAVKAALKEFGSRGLTAERPWVWPLYEWRADIVRDMGGEESVSAQQAAVLRRRQKYRKTRDTVSLTRWLLENSPWGPQGTYGPDNSCRGWV